MKKLILVFCLLCLGVLNVKADSLYYTNSNGVSFTKEQYNFFSKMYWEGYQSNMTQEDFTYYEETEMNENLVESVYANSTMSRATSVSDNNKTLKISKVDGTNYSNVSVTLTWNNNPTIKSYDVIGARLVNTSLLNTPVTRLYNNSGTTNFDTGVNLGNGFGSSVLLSGVNMRINQTYRVSNGGTVYASYQHAKKSISLANSKRYTISSNGYGKVFLFTGTASSTYDQMNGVSISV